VHSFRIASVFNENSTLTIIQYELADTKCLFYCNVFSS